VSARHGSFGDVNVQVTVAGPEDQPRLDALLELYVYDFSALLGIDVGDDGRFRAPPLDEYFTDPRRHAFLIRVDGKLAGFALVQQRSRLSGDEAVCDMAEFFVMRRYRRRGVGERVAAWLFDRFAGPWEVREKPENEAATAFWRRAIGRYTGGRFEELLLGDERWRGPVQRFDSRQAAARAR
jgi:predicted acetyltransferase